MARGLRDIRRKIKAVQSTRQVTKAMELVAASKMRRAVQNAQDLRRYALSAWHILQHIGSRAAEEHLFLKARPAQHVLVVLLTSDRGLCGSLNTHLCRACDTYLKEAKKAGIISVDFVGIGRKGQQHLARTGQNVVAAFPALSNHPVFKDITPITRLLINHFKQGNYDHVVLIYPDFITPLVQEVEVRVILPLSKSSLKDLTNLYLQGSRKAHTASQDDLATRSTDILFEPSAQAILDVILPQLTEMQVYQSVLEAAASEHSARMVAMRSASDNASEILGDLTLTYNQTRQANITAELSELSAATAALS